MRTLRNVATGLIVGTAMTAALLAFVNLRSITTVATTEPTTTTTTTTTTTEPTTTTTVVVPADWHDEPRCDGKPCGPDADSPTETTVCSTPDYPGGSYTMGAKQADNTCPPVEEHGFSCPPDEWRRDDVRIDYAALADGCGPLVGEWL